MMCRGCRKRYLDRVSAALPRGLREHIRAARCIECWLRSCCRGSAASRSDRSGKALRRLCRHRPVLQPVRGLARGLGQGDPGRGWPWRCVVGGPRCRSRRPAVRYRKRRGRRDHRMLQVGARGSRQLDNACRSLRKRLTPLERVPSSLAPHSARLAVTPSRAPGLIHGSMNPLPCYVPHRTDRRETVSDTASLALNHRGKTVPRNGNARANVQY